MSDNLPAHITMSKASAWLPLASLALTVAAYGLGAPARLAHLNGRSVEIPNGLTHDPSIRYEPIFAREQPRTVPAEALQGLQAILSQRLLALK